MIWRGVIQFCNDEKGRGYSIFLLTERRSPSVYSVFRSKNGGVIQLIRIPDPISPTSSFSVPTLGKKATIHQVTTMLATSPISRS